MAGNSGPIFYRAGAALALATSFVQIWMNLAVGIVGEPDNPVNQGFYGVVAAAAACAFTARLRPDGMVRAMLAVAAMQALLTLAVATAPSTARVDPMGPMGVLMLSGGFVVFWLTSVSGSHSGDVTVWGIDRVDAGTREGMSNWRARPVRSGSRPRAYPLCEAS